jgi:hypothetical protein
MIAWLLWGCAHRAQTGPQVVVVHDPVPAATSTTPLVGALDGVGMMMLLPRERQAEEITRLTQSLASADLPTDRIELALLLALGDPSLRDAERARDLLEGRTWDDAGYETLVRVVLALLEERADRQSDKVQAQEAFEAERRLRRELQARLEAMKQIDTEIDARELGVEGQDGQAEDPVR